MYINKPLIHGSKFKNLVKSSEPSSSSEKQNKKEKEQSDDPEVQLN
jgi:hypothetical protein